MKRGAPLVLAIVLFAAAGLLWIVSDRRAAQRIYDELSTASTGDRGLSLAAGYLGKTRKVRTLTRPFGREPVEANAVVFRFAAELPIYFDPEELDPRQFGPPKPKRSPLLNDAEEAFVRRGGRFIIGARDNVLPGMRIGPTVAKKVFPIWPAIGDQKMGDPTYEVFTKLGPRMHAIFVAEGHTVLARERIGSGELFVLSVPEMIENDELRLYLPFLEALAGSKRPVYFDEMIHGLASDDGPLALMQEWNLGPFLLLLLATTALLFWRHGRRVGPAEEDYREVRSDAIDLVRSLGALYRDVTSDTAAIALYHDALVRTVALQTGLRGEPLHQRVNTLTGGIEPPYQHADAPAAELRRQLTAINEAFAKLGRKSEVK
ncbi:MAG: hypothetical protein QOH21_3111 [Acidobacteriota bacterium]|jgi:hypothetical protein|nr:hypothetical protein [Acidobacteriota bacterium]